MKNRVIILALWSYLLYEALFGCKIKISLNTSNLPHDFKSTIENEEHLAEIITEQPQEINSNVKNDVSDTELKEIDSNVENELSDTDQLLSTTIRETIKLKKWKPQYHAN